MRRLLSAALTSTFALVACAPEGDPGACYRTAENACTEYGRAQGAAGKRTCSSGKWYPGDKACPTENRLGTCLKAANAGSDVVYSGPPNNFTLRSAKNTCEWAGGVFLQDGSSDSKR